MSRKLDLDAIQQRAEAAAQAPWKVTQWRPPGSRRSLEMVMTPSGCLFNSHNGINDPADAEFVAHARADVPALVSRVRSLEAHILRAVDTIAQHRDGDVVPVGAVMAALVISDEPITEAHVERAREIEALIDSGVQS